VISINICWRNRKEHFLEEEELRVKIKNGRIPRYFEVLKLNKNGEIF